MDVNLVITRIGIFITLYTIVLGVPFYIGYHTNSWIWSTSVAVLLATVGPLIYTKLQRKAGDIILAEQRRYQKILLQAASGMAQEHNLERLLELIVRVVKKAVKIEYVAVFLEDKEKQAYVMRVVRSDKPIPKDISVKFSHPFVEFMKNHREPFLVEELLAVIKQTIDFPLNIALIVPSFYSETSTGFMILGEKLNKKAYSIDDIDMFKVLSRQTSLAIENCIFIEEFKKAQERVSSAEKLASIGGLAEGVAHQINNRLHIFSMNAAELTNEVNEYTKDNKKQVESDEGLKKAFDYFMTIAGSLKENINKTKG